MAAITGDEAGLVKVWDVRSKKLAVLAHQTSVQSRKKAVAAMCWLDAATTAEALVAHEDGTLCSLARTPAEEGGGWAFRSVTSGIAVPISSGLMVDVSGATPKVMVLTDEGVLECREFAADCHSVGEATTLRLPRPIACSALRRGQLAFGGKENDLKVFDLKAEKVTFKAMNVPVDWLGLRVPIFPNSLDYVNDDDENLIVLCSAHRQVRLYDRRAQPRPVLDLKEMDRVDTMPTCIRSLTRYQPNRVAVGDATGQLFMIDLKKTKFCGKLTPSATGSIRGLALHPTQPVLAATGLGRFANFYDLHSFERVTKAYLKQKSTAILFANDDCFVDKDVTEQDESWQEMFTGELPAMQELEGELVQTYAGTPTENVEPTKLDKLRAKRKLKRQIKRGTVEAPEASEPKSARTFKRKLSSTSEHKPKRRPARDE